MEPNDIAAWLNDTFHYHRPGWTIHAMVGPNPVAGPGDWVLVHLGYTEPDSTPGADRSFTQNRYSFLDPITITGLDDLRVWIAGNILWSVVHEERERMREGPDDRPFYHPHIEAQRAAWADARDHVLAMVE